MQGVSEGWLFGVCSIAAVWVILLIKRGPAQALGPAIALSFLFPVWLKVQFAGVPFDIRTTITALALLGYICHPDGKIRSPLTLLDFCIAMMWCSHVVSDIYADGFNATLPLRAYGEWVLPYVAGRFAIRDRQSLAGIAPWIAGVLVVLGILSCVESISKINPFESVFGNRPSELAYRGSQRLGFKRAFGPTMHPIFFGMLQATLLPWLAFYRQPGQTREVRVIIWCAFLISVAGIVCTVSRTPALTVVLVGILLLAFCYVTLRWPLALITTATIVLFLIFPNEITDTISRWTGGGEKLQLVEIDGKAVESSSSRSRLVVLRAYSDAAIKAGPIGFGSEATSTFPPKIPYMQGKTQISHMFKMIDNGYLLITLRFGWIGGISLLMLFMTATFTGFSLSFENSGQIVTAAMGCLFAVTGTISLMLVWLSYDFAFPLLWSFGIISGLASARSARMYHGGRRGL